jgi:DNA-binding transcriptional ArsR family regulator
METGNFDEQAAKKVLNKDFENLIKKVASGKTLTAAERARIEARAAGSEDTTAFAKNLVELAEVLGVTRRTLSSWRKITGAPKPEPNGSHDVSAWREFVRSRGLKGGGEPVHNQEALKARKLLAEIEERELRLAIKRGDYLSKDDVRKAVLEGLARLFAILHKRLEDELPPLSCGKDAVGIREENAKALDEARGEAYEFFRGWTAS